jgi:peptide/nickel transport system ATP-binding protein
VSAVIAVAGLTVVDAQGRCVVDGVTLDVAAGERVGIVGESGAGKTTLALALVGALRPGLRVTGGSVRVDGVDVLGLRGRALRRLRRRTVSYLHQDPASALSPTIRVRGQVAELAADRSPGAVAQRLAELGLPTDAPFLRRYPHQLSGGQRQRLALARATAGRPRALVLDEPTSGVDPHARELVLEQIAGLARRQELTLVVVSHDLDATARLCDRVVVLVGGAVVEEGPAVLTAPVTPYARELVAAVPTLPARRPPRVPAPAAAAVRPVPSDGAPPALRVTDLSAGHRDGRRIRPVLSGVSFDVRPGECLALLGPSGSGKTTIARCVAGTHRRSGGRVELDGVELAADVHDRTVDQRRRIQVVPQHSAGSLNPRRTVGAAIARPLRLLHGLDAAAAARQTERLLAVVGLPEHLADRYPAELSGGQCQRITIARALAARPQVLVCDEMTSSLDVRVQAAVLDLLDELRESLRIAVLLITHDAGVTARSADRVLVLGAGAGECLPVGEFVRRHLADRFPGR